tara:strand:- start:179 stop:622 length:444 start_codon:yes stop_codon:yes gene_type:complete
MGHTIEEIQDDLRRANSLIADSQSAADGASSAAEEAYSYSSDAQSSAEESANYAEEAESYIRGVLDMLDGGLDTNPTESDFIEPLSHLNEKLTAIAAVVADALTHLNSILSDINQEHLPLEPSRCVVTHEFLPIEEEKEEEQTEQVS